MEHITDEAVVEASAEVETLIAAYRLAKADAAAAKVREDKARKALTEAFEAEGAAEFVVGGDRVLVKRSLVRRESLDAETVRRLAPKAFEKARKVSEFYRLTLGK